MSTSSHSSPPVIILLFLHLLLLLPPCCRCCSRHLLLHGDANAPSSLTDTLHARDGNVTDGLRRYLARFGYASTPDDADGRLVVSLFQSTLGLPVTGHLDARTLDLLATPRCGVPDLLDTSTTNANARFAFFAGQPRWARAPGHFLLTYAVVSAPPYQPPRLKPEAAHPQGGPHPGRRLWRAGALRLQPALQPQLPLRARHLLSRPGGGHHQVAREDDDDAYGHPALAHHRHSSAPPLLA
ncbi:metalloendoproteinase 1-like [Triticum aestivum]|uniref:metalloendoproteinase 1-like n=1 Tax=Triticum aestivum TaxID=4565 RepID=UPI001D00AB49|nr:metalloendoproteinase 1-like [Triticum aestivum]